MVREHRVVASVGLLVWLLSTVSAQTSWVYVPGTADPWLAGMPNGSTASDNTTPTNPDVAPAQSPVLVTDLTLVPGDSLYFQVGWWGVAVGPGGSNCGARSGDGCMTTPATSHLQGAENGLSDVTAPFQALMGVFLGDERPDLSPAPSALSFPYESTWKFRTLAPELKQVFFIGDGQIGQPPNPGGWQMFVVPAGATRLYLGIMDSWGWFNNAGHYDVGVTVVPVPRVQLTASSGDGGAVTTPGEGAFLYPINTVASLTATPDLHYHFVNWTGTGVTTGDLASPTSASTTVTMRDNRTVVAHFAIDQHTLTTSCAGLGSVTTPGVGSFTYNYGTSVAIAAMPQAGYHFVNWTGTAVTAGYVTAPTSASTTVLMQEDATLIANFAPDSPATLTLTVSSSDGGAVSAPGEGGFSYVAGTVVSVVAAAEQHCHFMSWTGTAVTAGKVASPTSASTTVTVDASYTLIANFAADQMTLTTASGDGGAVSSPGEGSFAYSYGTVVPVIAAPEPHCHFVSWTGTAVAAGKVADPLSPSTTVTVDAPYTLVASFAVDQVALTTSSGDGGAVSSPGEGGFMYGYGAIVPVMATANAHYHFVNWTGTAVTAGKVASPTSANATVTMDASYTLIANFAADQLTLTTSSGDGGAVSSPGEGSFQYDQGSTVVLEARPDPLFRFAGWSGGLSAGSNPYTLTMDADYTVKACFESVLDDLVVGGGLPEDLQEQGTSDHPFKTLQGAIEAAKDGAKLIIRPGKYPETIDLMGKSIELNGLGSDPNVITALPVIDGQGKGTAIRCTQGEDANCVLVGLVITGGSGNLAGGILCVGSSPTLSNCLIVGNRATGPDGVGGGIYCQDSKATIINCTVTGNYGSTAGAGVSFKDSLAVVINSIIWGNGPSEIQATGTIQPVIGYTDVAGGWVGTGNFNADPLFAGAGYWANPSELSSPVSASVAAAVWVAGDYHVKSQAGRWNPVTGLWVKDAVTSPCIDGGNPASAVGLEPVPNGNRINQGVYGGTNQASLTNP